jgi:hypothetical protein
VTSRGRVALIALAVLLFLALSFELARWLTTENRERDAVYGLLVAQARGDERGVLARLEGCARLPACRATATSDARRLRRPGRVKILAYDSKTAYALGAARGLTRVAWTVIGHGLPVVQCVAVHRGGTALAGRSITLTALSAPIGNEASC